jgi:polysaccharide export outer membrane protein
MSGFRQCSVALILVLGIPIFAGCAAGPSVAIRRLEQHTPRSRAYALPRAGPPAAPAPPGQAEAQPLPPGVTEVTPPQGSGKTYVQMEAKTLSHRDYIRSRFPTNHVVFPDELLREAQKPEYYIGVDDVLQVLVWNQPDLSLDVLVRKDGSISFPLAGNLKAEGLTVPQLERILTERLSSFVDHPNVVVNPKQINSLRIFIVGAIRPPQVSLGPVGPAFVLRGGNTLLEVLSNVEFEPTADLAASYISRGNTIIPVDLKALFKDGDLTQNVLLEPGDRVVVPFPLKQVTVLGEVNAPDRYSVNLDTTLVDALSIAKGVKFETADLYMAYVARKRQVLPINLKRLLTTGDESQNLLMQDGDIVYVPDIRDNRFSVVGEVFRPGVISYTEPIDVVEAVARSGGFLITAERSQVVVVRGDIRSPQVYAVDALGMIEGKFGERFTLQRGDIVYVPRTAIADWNVFVTQLLPTIEGAALIRQMAR